jgi:hypothetical protein
VGVVSLRKRLPLEGYNRRVFIKIVKPSSFRVAEG